MKRLGILTGGGDAPGLNAVIRAVVKTAHNEYGSEVLGIRDGFEGLLKAEGIMSLTPETVRGILPRGGTILGAANRGNPFARRVMRDGEEVIEDCSGEVLERISELDLDAMIVVGGDGTLRISQELYEKGSPIVGVPKTIDNDIRGTDVAFGFDTAVNTATEAIDRLHTTAESHHRVMVLELMGRDAGFIALRAGIAGGADVILIPEIPFRLDSVCDKIMERAEAGRHFSILAVAEGAYQEGGEQVFVRQGDRMRQDRLGGIGRTVSRYVEGACGVESRVIVLGHLQRGGSPTAFDRWLATCFGGEVVRLAAKGGYGRMVSLRGEEIIDVELKGCVGEPKCVNVEGDAVLTAKAMGICMGV
jgi:6-phosphofructokinase 1